MKNIKRVMNGLLGSALLVGVLTMPVPALAQEKSKVVIQVSDNDPMKWKLAMGNAKNVQKDLGMDKVDLEIVAYGPGIMMLKSQSQAATAVAALVNSGVKVVACENTMKSEKLTKKDMNAAVGYVPSGVVEIVHKQEQGYAYVRP